MNIFEWNRVALTRRKQYRIENCLQTFEAKKHFWKEFEIYLDLSLMKTRQFLDIKNTQ